MGKKTKEWYDKALYLERENQRLNEENKKIKNWLKKLNFMNIKCEK